MITEGVFSLGPLLSSSPKGRIVRLYKRHSPLDAWSRYASLFENENAPSLREGIRVGPNEGAPEEGSLRHSYRLYPLPRHHNIPIYLPPYTANRNIQLRDL